MLILFRCRVILMLGLLCAGCGDSSTTEPVTRWLLASDAPLPASLSEVGLYEDITLRAPYDDLVPYVPRHALYSDGLDKERYLYLPEGSTIEVTESGPWTAPVGTVLVKTFLYEDAPIETRLVFRTSAGWDYAVYEWLPDASDADLLTGNWAEVPLVVGADARQHTLPSRLDCRTCHETHEAFAGSPMLGIGSLQTDTDLVDARVFSEPPTITIISGRTDEETAALGYFVGNCISCHNDGASLNASFSLYPDEAVANTIDQPTESETGEGIRVVPGSPAQSVLYITVAEAGSTSYRGPFKVMPPIGVDVTDPVAGAVLGAWIEGL